MFIFFFGNDGAGGAGSGGRSGPGGGGGFLAPFSRGAQIGNAFNGKQEDGSYKTVTSMTGMDKAINAVKDYQEDKKQNGAHVAKVDALDKVMTGASQAINNAKMSVAQSSVVGKAYSSGYSEQEQRKEKFKPNGNNSKK